MGEGIGGVGDVNRADKFFLKGRFDGRFHIAHPTGRPLRFSAFGLVEQDHAGAVTGGIAHRLDTGQLTVGNQPQNHGMKRVNIAAKAAG